MKLISGGVPHDAKQGGELRPPFSRKARHGASLALITTTPWKENAPATQATTTVPPWTAAPRPESGLPFKQCYTR
jgi:hypothetical protein